MKKSIVFCFLFFFFLPCYAQEQAFIFQSDTQTQSVNWEQLEQNLNELEQNLLTLQTNNENLKTQLQNAKRSLTTQRNYLTSLSLQYKDLESKYTQSERNLKKWKLACGITVVVTIPTITILAIILANRWKN